VEAVAGSSEQGRLETGFVGTGGVWRGGKCRPVSSTPTPYTQTLRQINKLDMQKFRNLNEIYIKTGTSKI
jgi:hypothetical protein